MPKWTPLAGTRFGLAIALAALAFAICFTIFGSMATDLVMFLYDNQAGNDPGAGDSIGWAVVFAAPVLLAVDIVVSLVAAMFVYRLSRKAPKASPGSRERVAIRLES